MNAQKSALVIVAIVVLVLVNPAAGQRRRGARSAPPKAPVAQPTPTPKPASVTTQVASRTARKPVPLAIVNGQTITTSELDPRVGEAVETLDQRLAETRSTVLSMEINTLLLAAEARKRNIQPQQLYEQEVVRRISQPTEAEIAKVMEENRDQLNQSDPAAARAEVVEFIRSQREEGLREEFVNRLRSMYPVVMGADINSPNLAPSTVVATVAGRAITAGSLEERLKPIIYKMKLGAFQLQRSEVDQLITNMLLLAEANRRNVPPEDIVRTEITNKIKTPSEADVTKFYNENKSRIGGDLNSVRNQLANFLQDQERDRLEIALAENLRKNANVQILFREPVPPTQLISVDDDPSRGPATAPVTIVEFTDFQCPACAAMHPVLEDALKIYGPKVRFVVRDFPISRHTEARKAAEAANAAHAQGKFFEYAALLFKRQNALDVPSLKKYATELGLDRARFDAALDRGTYAAEVRNDMNDAEVYGVESTPTIFINGVMLRTLSAEALREAIDRALAGSTPKTGN